MKALEMTVLRKEKITENTKETNILEIQGDQTEYLVSK